MKTLIVGLVIFVALLVVEARADEVILFQNLTTSGTFGCGFDATGNVLPCQMNGFNKVSFQVTSVSGSAATITANCRNNSINGYAAVLTVTNPTSTELGYDGVGLTECTWVVVWSSGTLNGTLVRTK